MADVPPDLTDLPEAVAAPKSGSRLQLVWLIPLVAVLIGGWLAVKAIMERGPTITITFKTAEGLEAGKTKLKYKDVEIGLVKSVALAPDLTHVIATAELVKEAGRHLVEDTKFWVVRARISGGSVSGIGTLLSGSYIGIDVGKSTKPRRAFTGLEVPPVFQIDTPGREFVLHAHDLGSLDVGAPIFFRRLQVGQIVGYDLDKDGKGLTLKAFVKAPYDKYVTRNTRFWNASGVDLTLDSSGIKVQTQSVVSILLGGIAFESPDGIGERPPAAANTEFALFAGRTEAMKNPETEIMRTAMVFKESVRGLAPGAPIDFRGINIGEVVALIADVDAESKEVVIVVEANIYPERLRLRARSQAVITRKMLGRAEDEYRPEEATDVMVSRGLRAQLRTGNLLTGQLYIALDFFPDAAKARVDRSKSPPELPTVPSSRQELQAVLAGIGKKIDNLPLAEISGDLRQTLQSANTLIKRLDGELTPEVTKAVADARLALTAAERTLSAEAPLQQDARAAMRELARTAQAFRTLADYLERHPEALLRGKPEDQK